MDRGELEAYRGLLEEVGSSRAVLVTGTGERPAIALGLAAAAVVAGRRTILIECDLARATLARTLRLAISPGLGEYLRHEAEAAEILQTMILAGPGSGTASEPLVCVVAGAAPPHATTLLPSEDFQEVIAKLRRAYDLVVLDGPGFDDPYAVRAAAVGCDMVLACGADSKAPKALRTFLDGRVAVERPD